MSRLSRTRRIATTLSATVALAGIAAPAASARPALEGPPSDARVPASQEPAPRTVLQRVEDSGFDLGDAAIGAGAGVGLVLLAVGGVSAGSHRRLRFIH